MMIVELLRRHWEQFIRDLWTPQPGDRIQFLNTLKIATIDEIELHNGGFNTRIRFHYDDNTEGKIEYFRKRDVRLVAPIRPGKRKSRDNG